MSINSYSIRSTLLLLLLIVTQKVLCQGNDNPIVFVEAFAGGGGSFGEYSGVAYGATANYQSGKNLFTFRYMENPDLNLVPAMISYIGLPLFRPEVKATESAMLYGRRYITNGISFSFSGGLSTNSFKIRFRDDAGQRAEHVDHYLGFAYELNFKLFKSERSRYRIYTLFPIGRPTAFGRSFGIKVFGNISRHSYLGAGITYGFGWHKRY